MNSSRIKIAVLVSLYIFMALPVIAQPAPTSWYHRDTNKENKVINQALKDNHVEKRYHEHYKKLIQNTFDELWSTAKRDSLYDWSRVESLQRELNDKKEELRRLEDTKRQTQVNGEPLDDWASDEEVMEFELFKEECLKEINDIKITDIIEKDSLKFVNNWTQLLLDKKRDESKRVLDYIKKWGGKSSPEADAMLKKFEEMEDEMILLCEMDQADYNSTKQRLREMQKGNQVAQLETEIIYYLASEPYNDEKTKSYFEQYNGKNRNLRKALSQHAEIHNRFVEYLEQIAKYGDLSASDDRTKVTEFCDNILNKYNKNEYPYLDNLREVIKNFQTMVKEGKLNSAENFKKQINKAKNAL